VIVNAGPIPLAIVNAGPIPLAIVNAGVHPARDRQRRAPDLST